jgi:signal-transduction protein with cAMP-binding, CBS, and nucleotidyltransferase domain
MTQQIKDVMTKQIHSVRRDATLRAVARVMKQHKIGVVLVTQADGSLLGLVTDRDLVVRGMASDRDVDKTSVAEICSTPPVKLDLTAMVDDAVRLMRERSVRRIPVVADGKPVGIISIGDLARAKDPGSLLAQISAAPPNE